MVNAIIALCAILTGIVGTYFYMKDKTVIATSIGAKFDLYWKVFGFFFVLGGITGMIVLVFLKEFGVYIALGLGAIAILFAVRGNKEVDAGARQKQYNLAGIFLFAALGVAILTFMLGDNKKVEDKPPAVHHTIMTPQEKPKPKPQEEEELEFNNAETKPQEQTVTNSGKEVYVGAYNDGTKVYILTDTIKRNAGNFTCTVKAGQDQLHYRFDGQNYSNSEGYHGNIHDGKSPVALAIYNYCTNGTSNVAPTGKHWIKDANDVYLWNPEPRDGESITWSGGFVQDGNYKFADGAGTLVWYRDGEVIQVDHGTFRRGRHHGRFSHEFPSGRVIQSNWNNGVEIP